MYVSIYIYTGLGKYRFTVLSTQNTEFILVLLCINYCIIFRMNICKATFASPCMSYRLI